MAESSSADGCDVLVLGVDLEVLQDQPEHRGDVLAERFGLSHAPVDASLARAVVVHRRHAASVPCGSGLVLVRRQSCSHLGARRTVGDHG